MSSVRLASASQLKLNHVRSAEPETPVKILHLANHHSTNIGNGALIQGLERTIREDFAQPVHFVHEAWDDYTIPEATKTFDRRFVQLCEDVDCLVVGAAVTLVGIRQHVHTGMRFNLPLELWDEIRCPIVFYGLSYRTWPRQHYHHRDKLAAAIEYACQSDRCLFSVRNDGTREWLGERLKIDTSRIYEVPDPAVFVQPDSAADPWMLHPDQLSIAISFNDEDARQRFPRGRASWRNRLTAQLHPSRRTRRKQSRLNDARLCMLHHIAKVLDRLGEERSVQVVLCPHHYEDFGMIADFFDSCSSRLKHQIVQVNALPKSEHASQFYNLYRTVDLTLAMRVHSMSPSIGVGTPTIALSSQPRLTDFMRNIGLDEYCLDVFAADFKNQLWQRCQQIISRPSQARQDMQSAVADMRHHTRQFNARVEKVIMGQPQHV